MSTNFHHFRWGLSIVTNRIPYGKSRLSALQIHNSFFYSETEIRPQLSMRSILGDFSLLITINSSDSRDNEGEKSKDKGFSIV